MRLTETKRRLGMRGFLVLVTLCFLFSCKEQHRSDSNIEVRADSLLNVARENNDMNRLIVLCDSLEATGDISSLRAAFVRSVAYDNLGKKRLAEHYYNQVINVSQDDLKDLIRKYPNEQLAFYCSNAAVGLSELMSARGDYEGALRIALKTLDEIDESQEDYLGRKAILQLSIARSQMELGHESEAKRSLDKSYQLFMEGMKRDTTWQTLNGAIICAGSVASQYLDKGKYEDAKPWLERQDLLTTLFEQHPNSQPEWADCLRALDHLNHAMLAYGSNKLGEAKNEYWKFQASDYAKTPQGKFNGAEFLQKIGRYAEAADINSELDGYLEEWGVEKYSFHAIKFLKDKFIVNDRAGRRDSALAVAAQIIDRLDSTLILQQQNEAAELSMIYDSQEKDKQIAQQKISIIRLIIIAVSVILVLTVFFLSAYIVILRRSAKRKAEASRMRTDFIQQISHEIRTPLNVLSGFSQILVGSDMELSDEIRRQAGQEIQDNTQRITELVDKIIELSEANKKRRQPIQRTDSTTAGEIVAEAVGISGIDKAPHLDFYQTMSPEVIDLAVTTNYIEATKALAHLLSNAKKFTHLPEAHHAGTDDQSKKRVSLTVSKTGKTIRFEVEDTGIGVPTEEAEHIFKEFVQLDKYYEGIGIGLTLARSKVRRLGGNIWLDTTYSGGARFVMTLSF